MPNVFFFPDDAAVRVRWPVDFGRRSQGVDFGARDEGVLLVFWEVCSRHLEVVGLKCIHWLFVRGVGVF